MNHEHLTDVESTNLRMLYAIRLGIEQDRVATCAKFALNAALADHLTTLSQDQIWSFVAHVGQTTLFPPRLDLLSLFEAPVSLVGPLAAVRPPRPSSPSSPL